MNDIIKKLHDGGHNLQIRESDVLSRTYVLRKLHEILRKVSGQCDIVLKRNGDGCPMTKGSEEANLYCGRTLGADVIPGSDGRCGPNSGPQCPSCLRAQRFRSKPSFRDALEDFSEGRDLRIEKAVKTLNTMILQNTDVNSKNDKGDTALMIAAAKGAASIFFSLVAGKADINAENKGKSVLDVTESKECRSLRRMRS